MDANVIALDHHEQTKICTFALEALLRAFEESPSLSFHQERINDLVGAHKEDPFVFTSSGAEAINQVFWSVYFEEARKKGKTHFLAASIEDFSTLHMLKRLEELGCYAKMVPIKESGEIDVAQLQELISPRTALISLSLAHPLTGVIQPIEEIAAVAKKANILLHLDVSYAIGKIYFSFSELGVDYLSFSGEPLHAGTGSGGLFASKKAPLSPLILGARPFDFPHFMALSSAAGQASLFLDKMSLEVARLRNFFETEIVRQIPDATIVFESSYRLPNTTVIAFPKLHQEALSYLLAQKQIATSIGGIYSQPLHRILSFSQVPLSVAESAVSFSLSRTTTEEEIRKAVKQIQEQVHALRLISEDL